MNKSHDEVVVTEKKYCDFCKRDASYDGKTIYRAWGYMCKTCFEKYGVGLGLGKGQKLVLKKDKA